MEGPASLRVTVLVVLLLLSVLTMLQPFRQAEIILSLES